MNRIVLSLTLAFFSVLVGCQNPTTPKTQCKPQYCGPLYKGHHLVYYYRDNCPFSQRVTSYLQLNQIPVTWKDIRKEANAKELVKVGGRKRVPCLVVDGKAIYGSNAILQWLEEQAETR